MGYRNRWDASDQIPLREIETGTLDRFGQVDSTLGGESQRYSLSANWKRKGASTDQRLEIYAAYYDLDLYSDFTYFLEDSVNGDQIQQADQRVFAGASFEHRQPAGKHYVTLGAETRADFINDVGLHRTRERRRLSTVREDDVVEWGTGAYASARTKWSGKVASLLGLRGDFYLFDVESDRLENSGNRTDGVVTPKLSLILGPWVRTEIYLSGGLGFHSNDARGTVIQMDPESGDPVEAVDPLVLSRGGEIGFRSTPLAGWHSTLTGWTVELDSELLFVGDAGTTEPSGQSRRFGVSWTNFYRLLPRLSLDLDLAWAHARFTEEPEGADRIPGAMENVIAGGVAWDALERGLFGSLRLRHFGAYPLVEDDSRRAPSTTLLNGSLGYLHENVRLTLSVLNLLDEEDSDIQYFYESRLRSDPKGVEDVHLKPVESRQARVSLVWGF
jgi:hypothetical protein